MSSTKNPIGLQPAKIKGNAPNTGGLQLYTVGASSADDIGRNDPVQLNTSGQIARVSGGRPFGVATGFVWVDPTTKRPNWSNNLPAGTSSYDSNIQAYVVDDPRATFIVQADATVSAGDVGLNFTLSAVGSVNTLGMSQAVLKASTRTTAVGTVRLLGIYNIPGNAFGDQYPYVEVQWCQPADYTTSAF